ncbi:hypothetical protein D3C84_590100 [compost metagenome]
MPELALLVAETVASALLLEVAERLANRSLELRSFSAVWNSLMAPLSWPTAENFEVAVFSSRDSWASLGAFSAFTRAFTMLSMSMFEPSPVIPAIFLYLANRLTLTPMNNDALKNCAIQGRCARIRPRP